MHITLYIVILILQWCYYWLLFKICILRLVWKKNKLAKFQLSFTFELWISMYSNRGIIFILIYLRSINLKKKFQKCLSKTNTNKCLHSLAQFSYFTCCRTYTDRRKLWLRKFGKPNRMIKIRPAHTNVFIDIVDFRIAQYTRDVYLHRVHNTREVLHIDRWWGHFRPLSWPCVWRQSRNEPTARVFAQKYFSHTS